MKKSIAIIPARGGSKRLSRKNVLNLNGKPLIAWSIESALTSEIFEDVLQEDVEIIEKKGKKHFFIKQSKL